MRSQKIANFVLAGLLVVTPLSRAATLTPETVAAWQSYVQSVRGKMQDRIKPGGTFLWADQDAARAARLRDGEIVIAPAPGPVPRKVSGGLIHDWNGAAFFPNTTLSNILQVTQDYDRYKEFYRPSVIDSKTKARSPFDDTFSMLLMNKAFFLKTALDADYRVTNVRLDDRRFYSLTETTRVQEVENYNEPDERRMPEGEGGGYIWKLFSVVRLEERDGGVYVEEEAVALSRDVPGALRMFVDPIVRRVSRNSMLVAIQQTEEAVHSRILADLKQHVPAYVEPGNDVSSSFRRGLVYSSFKGPNN